MDQHSLALCALISIIQVFTSFGNGQQNLNVPDYNFERFSNQNNISNNKLNNSQNLTQYEILTGSKQKYQNLNKRNITQTHDLPQNAMNRYKNPGHIFLPEKKQRELSQKPDDSDRYEQLFDEGLVRLPSNASLDNSSNKSKQNLPVANNSGHTENPNNLRYNRFNPEKNIDNHPTWPNTDLNKLFDRQGWLYEKSGTVPNEKRKGFNPLGAYNVLYNKNNQYQVTPYSNKHNNMPASASLSNLGQYINNNNKLIEYYQKPLASLTDNNKYLQPNGKNNFFYEQNKKTTLDIYPMKQNTDFQKYGNVLLSPYSTANMLQNLPNNLYAQSNNIYMKLPDDYNSNNMKIAQMWPNKNDYSNNEDDQKPSVLLTDNNKLQLNSKNYFYEPPTGTVSNEIPSNIYHIEQNTDLQEYGNKLVSPYLPKNIVQSSPNNDGLHAKNSQTDNNNIKLSGYTTNNFKLDQQDYQKPLVVLTENNKPQLDSKTYFYKQPSDAVVEEITPNIYTLKQNVELQEFRNELFSPYSPNNNNLKPSNNNMQLSEYDTSNFKIHNSTHVAWFVGDSEPIYIPISEVYIKLITESKTIQGIPKVSQIILIDNRYGKLNLSALNENSQSVFDYLQWSGQYKNDKISTLGYQQQKIQNPSQHTFYTKDQYMNLLLQSKLQKQNKYNSEMQPNDIDLSGFDPLKNNMESLKIPKIKQHLYLINRDGMLVPKEDELEDKSKSNVEIKQFDGISSDSQEKLKLMVKQQQFLYPSNPYLNIQSRPNSMMSESLTIKNFQNSFYPQDLSQSQYLSPQQQMELQIKLPHKQYNVPQTKFHTRVDETDTQLQYPQNSNLYENFNYINYSHNPYQIIIPFKIDAKPQQIECGEWMTWTKNCHQCTCKDGKAMCSKIPGCVLKKIGEPMMCKPYSRFKLDECYSCECNADGVPECDAKNCQGSSRYSYGIQRLSNDNEYSNSLLESRPKITNPDGSCDKRAPTCESGTSWISSCHECWCIDGHHRCTKLENCVLFEENYGQPAACRPNTSFYTKPYNGICLKCTCDDEGQPNCES